MRVGEAEGDPEDHSRKITLLEAHCVITKKDLLYTYVGDDSSLIKLCLHA